MKFSHGQRLYRHQGMHVMISLFYASVGFTEEYKRLKRDYDHKIDKNSSIKLCAGDDCLVLSKDGTNSAIMHPKVDGIVNIPSSYLT